MATTQANPQERIARNRLNQHTHFLGVDGDEAAVVVVGGDLSAGKFDRAETSSQSLRDWCEHTRRKRSLDVGPHVGGSLVGDFVRGVET
nr:hypothetical protein [Halomicroarcula limicola]